MCRAVHAARTATADIADHELQGPADGEVGAVALAEHVDTAVHTDGLRARTVTDDDRTHRHRGGQHAVDVELVGARGLHGSKHPREILGFATGHDGVDRNLLHRDLHEVRWHDRNEFVRSVRGSLEHAQHAGLGGRHDGEAVGPAALEQCLHLVLERCEFDAACTQF